MSARYQDSDEEQQWEREHDHKLRWKCPQCEYEYEAPRYENEALKCPEHGCRTVNIGESYA